MIVNIGSDHVTKSHTFGNNHADVDPVNGHTVSIGLGDLWPDTDYTLRGIKIGIEGHVARSVPSMFTC
jgi:hypothetical protein